MRLANDIPHDHRKNPLVDKKIYSAGPDITQHEIDIVTDALKNGWYGKNAYYYCELFQDEFAKYHNRKYGIMTPNCTTAIHLLLKGLGIEEGDEVLVPECTWIGSTAGISWLGATPVFCDIEKDSWCLDPDSVLASITPKTKAIITVNLFGNMSDMKRLEEIADQYNLYLIEDAAESVGSTYNGIKSGKFGVGSTFSFHRTKTMTTGEGGMLLLDDEDLYERCMFLRDHGRSKEVSYRILEVAHKYMPFNIQAALGYAQFLRLDELVTKKREQFNFYKEALQDLPDIQFNIEPDNVFNSYWITAMVIGKKYGLEKLELIKKLEGEGVPTRPFFYPLSEQPAYNQFNLYKNKNINAYDISSRGINLPGAANLTSDQMGFVCKKIKKVLTRELNK